jgi:hypothetical protein
MELEIDLNDLKDSAVRRMLMKAIRSEVNRSKPMHQRKDEKSLEPKEDEATEDADDEMDDLVKLSEDQKGKATPVPMDDEDMSDESMDKMEPPKKGKKK